MNLISTEQFKQLDLTNFNEIHLEIMFTQMGRNR